MTRYKTLNKTLKNKLKRFSHSSIKTNNTALILIDKICKLLMSKDPHNKVL